MEFDCSPEMPHQMPPSLNSCSISVTYRRVASNVPPMGPLSASAVSTTIRFVPGCQATSDRERRGTQGRGDVPDDGTADTHCALRIVSLETAEKSCDSPSTLRLTVETVPDCRTTSASPRMVSPVALSDSEMESASRES